MSLNPRKLVAGLAVLITAFAVGCTHVGTKQRDDSLTTTRYELDSQSGRTNSIIRTESRQTSTAASGTAAVSSASAIKGFRADQDGEKQGLRIESAEQESDAKFLVGLLKTAARAYGLPTSPEDERRPVVQSVKPPELSDSDINRLAARLMSFTNQLMTARTNAPPQGR